MITNTVLLPELEEQTDPRECIKVTKRNLNTRRSACALTLLGAVLSDRVGDSPLVAVAWSTVSWVHGSTSADGATPIITPTLFLRYSTPWT